MSTYAFENHLDKFYANLRKMNLDISSKSIRNLKLPTPIVEREPTKTVWTNFINVAVKLHRDPNLLRQFLKTELCTEVNSDAQDALVLKGKFTVNQFERLLGKFVNTYIRCHVCADLNTAIVKEERLTKLRCLVCNSQKTVQ